jgi:hypothetical protein
MIVGLLVVGCSHGQTEPDAGEDAADAFDAGDDGETARDDGGDSGDPGDFGAGDGDGGDVNGDGDGSGSPYWPWCPEASEYVGEDWPVFVEVTENAVYCGTFYEMRTLEEEYRTKSRLRLIPGTYALPLENGTYPFFLPHCFEFIQVGEQPLPEGVGEIRANHSADPPGTMYRWFITQLMRDATGQVWTFEANLRVYLENEDTFTISGDYGDPWDRTYHGFMLCKDDCQSWVDNRRFASCHYDTATPQKHTVTFDGGSIELFIRMGQSDASTEPALFHFGSGTLDGTAFSQDDYYKLIYNPEHHHFSRDFIVLFDNPISSACGLKVQNLDPWNDDPAGRVALVRCDLSEIGERQVTEELFEILR